MLPCLDAPNSIQLHGGCVGAVFFQFDYLNFKPFPEFLASLAVVQTIHNFQEVIEARSKAILKEEEGSAFTMVMKILCLNLRFGPTPGLDRSDEILSALLTVDYLSANHEVKTMKRPLGSRPNLAHGRWLAPVQMHDHRRDLRERHRRLRAGDETRWLQ